MGGMMCWLASATCVAVLYILVHILAHLWPVIVSVEELKGLSSSWVSCRGCVMVVLKETEVKC